MGSDGKLDSACIDCKTPHIPDRMARLEEAKRSYEEERQSYHTSTTQNYSPLTILVTLTTCIEELITAFRHNRGIPNDFEITIKSGDSYWNRMRTLLTIYCYFLSTTALGILSRFSYRKGLLTWRMIGSNLELFDIGVIMPLCFSQVASLNFYEQKSYFSLPFECL